MEMMVKTVYTYTCIQFGCKILDSVCTFELDRTLPF